MTTLRFIKPWSTYRVGDTMETESPYTVERMVQLYGIAEVIDASGTVIPLPPLEPEPAESETRAIEEPPKDKMVRRARKKKGAGHVD